MHGQKNIKTMFVLQDGINQNNLSLLCLGYMRIEIGKLSRANRKKANKIVLNGGGIVILLFPFRMFEGETASRLLKKKHRLRMFRKRGLWIIFGQRERK